MTNISKYNASPSMAGYMFQSRLALLEGLRLAKQKPEGHISIEKFDDVAFENQNVIECMLQAKHNINPKKLTDTSVDIWKTVLIWIEQLNNNPANFLTTRFVILTTSNAPKKGAMALLRPGTSQSDRIKAAELLLVAAKISSNQTTRTAREAFTKLSTQERENLLSRIDVIDSHSNLIDMNEEIIGELRILSPDYVQEVARYLEGWWVGVVGEKLVTDYSASIPVQNILIKASEIGGKFQRKELMLDDSEITSTKTYTSSDEDAIFVKQMRSVNLIDSVIKRGVSDYYRATAQRSKWARENLLLDGENSKFDQKLKDTWERQRDLELTLDPAISEESKALHGRKLCLWAQQQQIPFRNIVETWITAGSYHSLADRLKVGWHPDFSTIFKNERNTDETT